VQETRKIGRRSSDGCIGLYNEKIAELFAITAVGSQVKIIERVRFARADATPIFRS
jgi:lipoprotein-anchoring transpeptidase ErfK/SrfK